MNPTVKVPRGSVMHCIGIIWVYLSCIYLIDGWMDGWIDLFENNNASIPPVQATWRKAVNCMCADSNILTNYIVINWLFE